MAGALEGALVAKKNTPSPWEKEAGTGRKRGYRIGWPEQTVASKVLDFEYTELQNDHILDDLAAFLKVKGDWPTVLEEFRRRYGDIQGVWLCPTVDDAIYYYGYFYGVGAEIYEWEYSPEDVIIDIGDDGMFVKNPTFIGEKGTVPKGHKSVRRE